MIEVFIRNKPGTINDEVYVVNRPDSGNILRFLTVENNEVVWKSVVEDRGAINDTPHFFMGDMREVREIVQAFVDAGKKAGIEVSSEAKNAGKLEATIKHLEDMRTLVFNK